MKKVFVILLFVLLLISATACEEEKKSAADGHSCIECGEDATHFSGADQRGALYFCDACYYDWLGDLEKNDVPVINGDFTDPENFGKRVN